MAKFIPKEKRNLYYDRFTYLFHIWCTRCDLYIRSNHVTGIEYKNESTTLAANSEGPLNQQDHNIPVIQ